MKSSKLLLLFLLIPIFLGIVIPGCSDKTFTSTETVAPQGGDPTTYIPLKPGLRVSYVVLEPETQNFDIEVTDPVKVAGYDGYVIRKTDRSTGQTGYSYMYEVGNAIFESGSTSSRGERILESPFVVGNTWNRFDTSSTPVINDYDDFYNDDNEINDGYPWDTYKTKPDDGYYTMSIVARESVEGLNGINYGNCIKVAWQTGEYSWNYYWYAAGIGLVKYEHNYNSLSAAANHTVGVMTDYQIVQY
jgi:hypothetical protein